MTYEEFENKLYNRNSNNYSFHLREPLEVYLDRPIAQWYMLIENKEYDPEGFNQEIEDKEEYKPFYDIFLDYKECYVISDNSDEWKTNHSKICPVRVHSFINTTCDGKGVESHKFLFGNKTKDCLLKAFKLIEEKGLNVVGCTYGDIRDEDFFEKINKKK